MNYTHLVFDVDGTLLNSEQVIIHALYDALLTTQDMIYPHEQLKFALGIPGEAALNHLGIEDKDSVLSLWDESMKKYDFSLNLFAEIPETIAALSKLNIELGIITSKTRLNFTRDFDKFHISPYFSCIVYADDTTNHKPQPDPMLKYLELAQVDSSKVLYVGDSIYDAQCAQAAKVDFALAGWGNSDEKRQIHPKYKLNSPSDLLNLIQSK